MNELINEVLASYPDDAFFHEVRKTLSIVPEARARYAAYERACQTLDSRCWKELKNKAMSHFRDHRPGQLKQGFFNQLNEAFAYQFLRQRGFERIRILPENGRRTPDIEYWSGSKLLACEVKTLGISDRQLQRRDMHEGFRGSDFERLSSGFLKKLTSAVEAAHSQVTSGYEGGLVYLVAFFDDVTLDNYAVYRRQIAELLQQLSAPEIYVKVTLLGQRRIYKRSPL